MITGPAQRKIVLMPSSTRRPSLPNSGPRWSITGMSIARRMRSGTGVGPGICRKWRPAVREEFCDMGGSLGQAVRQRCFDISTPRAGVPGRRGLSPSRPDARVSQASLHANPLKDNEKDWDFGMAAQILPGLERKLKAGITGDVMFDRFSRGRYATDASHYQ